MGQARCALVREEISHVLASAPPPQARLEALRLFLAGGEQHKALEILSASFEDWLEAGMAMPLWQVLEHRPSYNLAVGAPPYRSLKLTTWRLRLAVAIAGGAPLIWALDMPRPQSPEAQLWWAHAQRLGGAQNTAEDVALALLNAPIQDDSLRERASLLSARIALRRGNPETAHARLSWIDTEHPLATAIRARAHVLSGDVLRAVEAADRLQRVIGQLSFSHRQEIRSELRLVYMHAGHFRALRKLIGAATSSTDQHDLDGVLSDTLGNTADLLTHAQLAMESGQLDLAQRLFDALEPDINHAPWLRAVLSMNRVRMRLISGDVDAMPTHINSVTRDAARAEDPEFAHWADVARAYVGGLCASPLDQTCLLYTSPSPRDRTRSRMPSSS